MCFSGPQYRKCNSRERKSHLDVQEEKMRGVEFPWHEMVKGAIERHPAMLRQNQTDAGLPCHNGNAKNPQTHRGRKAKGESPPDRCRQPTPEPTPHQPRMLTVPRTPPAPPGDNAGALVSQLVYFPAGDMYPHSSLPCTELVTLDAYAQDSHHHTDFDPDMLSDEGTSSG